MENDFNVLQEIENEKIYYDLRRIALKRAQNILGDINDAEDIAQIVCLKYLQYKNTIDQPKAWVNRTAYNTSIDFAKKRHIPIGDIKYFEYNENSIRENRNDLDQIDSSEDLDIKIENLALKEVKKLLSATEFQLFKLVLRYENDSSKIAKKLNKSNKYVYGACHRMRKNLSAALYLKEGYRGSKKIVSFNLHRKILAFIDSLVKNMSKNDLSKMYNYFREIDISKIPILNIAQTFPYNIHLLSERSYDVYIPYQDTKGKVDCCIVDFKINKFNEIIITKFYPKPSVKISSDAAEIMEEFQLKRKGLIVKSRAEAKKIFQKRKT